MGKHCIDCKEKGVKKTASFSLPETPPLYCANCAKEHKGVINNKAKKCITCKKVTANFGKNGTKGRLYCAGCAFKEGGCINLAAKMCSDCGECTASFNFEGLPPDFCSECKEDGMMNVTKKHCIAKGCKTLAIFGNPETGIKEYCSEHKKDNMVDLHHRTCLECDVQASFNFDDETVPLYCATHAKEGMICLKAIKCEKCSTVATFNFPGLPKKFCAEHKEEGMVNVVNESCLKCSQRALFGFIGGKPMYCSEHAEDDMINLSYDICEKCDNYAYWNFPNHSLSSKGRILARFCLEHKEDGMEIVTGSSKVCIAEKCNKLACFNLKHINKPEYCKEHSTSAMVDVKHSKCISKECSNRAFYNNFWEKTPKYCFYHKEETMIDVCKDYCKTNMCFTRAVKHFENYCMKCFQHKYPNHKLIRNFKTRESEVVKFVTEQFPDYSWIFDRIIESGCSKKRPDIFVDMGFRILVVEIDENQHKIYGFPCEINRLNQLWEDSEKREMIVIRFNPDNYIDADGKKQDSCWKPNEKGIVKVPDEQKKQWTYRLDILKNNIQYFSDKKSKLPEKMDDSLNNGIRIVHLFFDLIKM